ncbi:hypothetical protein [Nonomuraea rubra]|uniref:hypothetical protein n=1 Tax=Nonomuraea rubra TaxID=46180 RepID=UPI0031EF7F76
MSVANVAFSTAASCWNSASPEDSARVVNARCSARQRGSPSSSRAPVRQERAVSSSWSSPRAAGHRRQLLGDRQPLGRGAGAPDDAQPGQQAVPERLVVLALPGQVGGHLGQLARSHVQPVLTTRRTLTPALACAPSPTQAGPGRGGLREPGGSVVVHQLVVGLVDEAGPAALADGDQVVQLEGRDRQQVGGVEPADEREGRFQAAHPCGGVAGTVLRHAQVEPDRGPPAQVGGGREVQGAAEVAHGLLVRHPALGVPGRHQEQVGRVGHGGQVGVVSADGGQRRVERHQRGRVQGGPARLVELGVEGLAHQIVHERVAPGAVRDDELRRHGLLERLTDGPLRSKGGAAPPPRQRTTSGMRAGVGGAGVREGGCEIAWSRGGELGCGAARRRVGRRGGGVVVLDAGLR